MLQIVEANKATECHHSIDIAYHYHRAPYGNYTASSR